MLIKKKEIQRNRSGAAIFIARKTGSVLCRIALWDCLEANFHQVNFLSCILFKSNNTSFIPQFGIDLLVISRGF